MWENWNRAVIKMQIRSVQSSLPIQSHPQNPSLASVTRQRHSPASLSSVAKQIWRNGDFYSIGSRSWTTSSEAAALPAAFLLHQKRKEGCRKGNVCERERGGRKIERLMGEEREREVGWIGKEVGKRESEREHGMAGNMWHDELGRIHRKGEM
jgi:hypothetical protein